MLFWCAQGVVVEVINHKSRTIGRKMDVEFEEEGDEPRWGRLRGREGKEDVSAGIDKVEEELWG